MKKITVYGSLLEGLGNWKWHLNNDESVKLGDHILSGPFKMISFGGFPGLVIDDSVENKIYVETYDVSDEVFKRVERLEGYPSFYRRTTIDTPFGESEVYTLANESYSDDRLVLADDDGIINWKKYKEK
jgi:gamma-glutamylcyclotransferase (GGCT)/AIG2-like uncharacterized protein YtfP